MSDEIILIIFMNSFAFLVQYISSKVYIPQRNYRDEQIDYLCEKICRLEKQVLYLEQEVEELYTETELKQSNIDRGSDINKIDIFGELKSKKYNNIDDLDNVTDDNESRLEDYINYDEY